MILVEGELQTRQYTDKSGNQSTWYEINAERVSLRARSPGMLLPPIRFRLLLRQRRMLLRKLRRLISRA